MVNWLSHLTMCGSRLAYHELCSGDVHNAADDNNEVKPVPQIAKIVLQCKSIESAILTLSVWLMEIRSTVLTIEIGRAEGVKQTSKVEPLQLHEDMALELITNFSGLILVQVTGAGGRCVPRPLVFPVRSSLVEQLKNKNAMVI